MLRGDRGHLYAFYWSQYLTSSLCELISCGISSLGVLGNGGLRHHSRGPQREKRWHRELGHPRGFMSLASKMGEVRKTHILRQREQAAADCFRSERPKRNLVQSRWMGVGG